MEDSLNKRKPPGVLLKQWRDEDAAALFKAMSDEMIYEYTREVPPRTALEVAMRYESRPDATGVIILNYSVWVDNELIGLCQAVIERGLASANLGYKISPKFWGIGIGTKLLGELIITVANGYGISVFRAEVDSNNVASIKILRRNGFVKISSKPSTLKFQISTELIFERNLSATDK